VKSQNYMDHVASEVSKVRRTVLDTASKVLSS
jgi:hypothetical protein